MIKASNRVLLVWVSHFTTTNDREIFDLCKQFCKKMHKNIDFLIIEHRPAVKEPKCYKLADNITVWHFCTLDAHGKEPVLGNKEQIDKIFDKYSLMK